MLIILANFIAKCFEEYKKWFEKNNIDKNDIKFQKNTKYFKNKLDYLEIKSCLLNKKKIYFY